MMLRTVVASVFVLVWLAGCSSSGLRNASEPVSSAAATSDIRQRAKVRTELAAEYFVQRNMAIALGELATAIKADPSYAPAYSVRGLVQMYLSEYEAADASFKKALELAPNDPEINNNYGWFLCQTGKEKEALDFFMQSIRNPLYQTPEKSWVNVGLCAMRVKDYKQAEESFNKALRPGPAGYVALLPFAKLEFERRAFEKSRNWLAELHRVVEPSAESLWLALRVERQLGDRSAEASYSAQLRRRFPDSREALDLRRGNFE